MKFKWENYNHLGHSFKLRYGNQNYDGGWYNCLNCNVKVYIDLNSHFSDKLMCWENNLFHNNLSLVSSEPVKEFNFSCAEMIIKSIIE